MQNTDDTSKNTPSGLSRKAVPAGIIVFCAIAYWFSTQFDRVPPILKRGIQPSDFPQLILGLIVILSLVLMIRDKSPAPERMTSVVWTTLGLLVGFILVAEIDLFLGLGLFAGALTMAWGERRWLAVLLVTLAVPIMVFFLFDTVFEVRFPRGLLTNLWYG